MSDDTRIELTVEAARLVFGRVPLFASDEESRPVLTAIEIKVLPDRIVAAAADGFHLGVQAVPAKVTGKGQVVLMPATLARRVYKALPKRAVQDGAAVIVVFTEANIDVTVDAEEGAARMSARPILGTYPDIAALIPKWKPSNSKGAVAFNPELLDDVHKAARIGIDFAPGILRWYFEKPSSPGICIVRSGDYPSFLAVVMPMFVDWDGLTTTKVDDIGAEARAVREYNAEIKSVLGGLPKPPAAPRKRTRKTAAAAGKA